MPELPSVEAARQECEERIGGRRIAEVHTVEDDRLYRNAAPDEFASAMRGRRVDGVDRKGKFLWLRLDARPWPIFHFGMTGEFTYYEDEADRPEYWKCELVFEGRLRMAVVSVRRLGRILLCEDPPAEEPVSRLGPDALDELPDTRGLEERLEPRSAMMKGLLLDQSFLSGIGNWSADEILYQSGIAPHRGADQLAHEEIKRLRAKIRYVLSKAVERNLRGEEPPSGWLYWRRSPGETIEGHEVRKDEIAGRSTYWVPDLQD